jgi:hypothetical protein
MLRHFIASFTCITTYTRARQGAIKRSALEKTGPTISYENFVDDLDIGDSFTTSLIDILVKVRSRPMLP